MAVPHVEHKIVFHAMCDWSVGIEAPDHGSACDVIPPDTKQYVTCSLANLPRTIFIAGEPTKVATNLFAGRSYKASGVSTCMILPASSTQIRSPMVMAST